MKHTISSRGFSLVELLVVITILAIISTVAYTSFSGATDKAKNSKRIESLTAIENALQLFRQANQYLPMPAEYSATTNLWGYNSTTPAPATLKNTIVTTKTGDAITTVTGLGGGQVMGIAASATLQIGAKGVIDPSVLPKSSLSQDLLDPGLKDIKVGSDKTFSDFGVGRYVYAVYAKGSLPATWNTDKKWGLAFNLATTILDDQKGPITKITGDFDERYGSCNGTCPRSLIGPGGAATPAADTNLKDTQTTETPYPLSWF